MGDPGEYWKCGIRGSIGEGKIRVSTEKGKIQESTGKYGIQVSTGEGKIRVSTGKGRIRRVPEMGDPSEYQKCGIRASIGNVGSERVSGR